MDRPQTRQAAPYRLQVSRPLLHAYTISDGGHEPVVGYALPVTRTRDGHPGPQPGLGLGHNMAAATRSPVSSPSPTTPNNNNNNNNNNKFAEPEEDIAAIAKQISDHAEAIYQTWKSRGLGPAEILNMPQSAQSSQAMEQLVNKFVVEDKARQAAQQRLSPATPRAVEKLVNSFVAEDKPRHGLGLRQGSPSSPSSSPSLDLVAAGLVSDENNKVSSRRSPVPSPAIEQLVNSFVSEDKARLAVQQQQQRANKSLPSSIQFALQKFENKTSPSPVDGRTSPTVTKTTTTTSPLSPAQPTRITPNKGPVTQQPPLHHQEIFLETIETSFPEDLITKPRSPTSDTVDGSAWPLKHKSSPRRASEYLDEVAREEERLINALKTGIILAEDPTVNNNKNSGSKKQADKDKSPVKKAAGVVNNKPVVDVNGKPAVNGLRPHHAPSSPANKVPHPASRPRQHASTPAAPHSPNPVRPFLTRGSVAERVLIFEKCPTELLRDSARRPAPAWRAPQGEVQARAQVSLDERIFFTSLFKK
ncbi:general transcriptional corepressor trfA-like [Frankliniella occidentalis]|uniref:General transcriptional corepressor trfA-like n=1 Tax=Frankliniella occidentalis TaxID=133901 RepID=A0A9C6XD86_FRAOC|nr:general transcriptional corepressor trfA-like [Frankliniella occidentalis]